MSQDNPFLEQIPHLPDYYKALAVARSAADSEIDKAFRKASLLYHPDKKPGDTAAAEQFKKLSGYRDVLKDAEQRMWYDYALKAQESGSHKQAPPSASSKSQHRSRSYSARQSDHYSDARRPRHDDNSGSNPKFEDRHPRDYAYAGSDHSYSRRGDRYESRSRSKTYSDSGYYSSGRSQPSFSDEDPDGCSYYSPDPQSDTRGSQSRTPRPSHHTPSRSQVFVIIGRSVSAIDKTVFESHFPTIKVNRSSDGKYKVRLEEFEPCLIIRLVGYAAGLGFLDKHVLSKYAEDYHKIDDKYKLAWQNSSVAAKLYVRLYAVAKKLHMPAETIQALRSRFVFAWNWWLAHESRWSAPSFPGCCEVEVRRNMTEEKCALAEFVYKHAPDSDRALLDPVLRSIQIEITYRDGSSTLDLLPLLHLASRVPQLAIDLATTRIDMDYPATCNECGVTKSKLRIVCRCGKTLCAKRECTQRRADRWFCPVCAALDL